MSSFLCLLLMAFKTDSTKKETSLQLHVIMHEEIYIINFVPSSLKSHPMWVTLYINISFLIGDFPIPHVYTTCKLYYKLSNKYGWAFSYFF